MVLLDTHVWWWSLAEPENLSKKALATIKKAKTDERFIASISSWEFAMMPAKRRIDLTVSPLKWITKAIEPVGLTVVELSPEIATEDATCRGTFIKILPTE
jgi:PIN domain nuclease of toxin-antitoxin system